MAQQGNTVHGNTKRGFNTKNKKEIAGYLLYSTIAQNDCRFCPPSHLLVWTGENITAGKNCYNVYKGTYSYDVFIPKRKKELNTDYVNNYVNLVMSLAPFKTMFFMPNTTICKFMWYTPRQGGHQMTLYLQEYRHCDPSTAESHEEEAANHQRPSANTLDSKTLQNRQSDKTCCDWLSTWYILQLSTTFIKKQESSFSLCNVLYFYLD